MGFLIYVGLVLAVAVVGAVIVFACGRINCLITEWLDARADALNKSVEAAGS